ncbi:MAG TPA: orotidine 5'-phosphate decarboxylase / HUMPS family protein [Candidatus Nanoarchaeia archaeon]|nr:orotidine 5'-phosphate decarboxylase / HUMPS family protein [Candidatus Nanoarchaeia archaeon]
MGIISQRERSIIPACDVPLDLYEKIVRDTADIEGVGAYKIGFELGLGYGLPRIVELTRKYNKKPIIYDHQKAGTDIPDTGKNFARTMKNAGVDAVIFFPQSGPETEKAWIEAAFEQDLGVIIGGLMTHPKYVRSEGGYLADEAIMEMYLNAAELGVSDFVVPGNRPEDIRKIKKTLEQRGVSPTFYAPGFVAQGGSISEAAKVAGNSWHAIVGRGIYTAEDIRKAALEHTSQL